MLVTSSWIKSVKQSQSSCGKGFLSLLTYELVTITMWKSCTNKIIKVNIKPADSSR